MKTLFISIILSLGFIQLYGQKPIFKADSFTLFPDKIVQGEYQAFAKTRNEIHSNYKSEYKKNTSRNIVLKFSINGLDNERKPGQDHHFTLDGSKKTDTADFAFAKPDPASYYQPQQKAFLKHNEDLVIRLNMRDVLNDFKTKGYYETFDGSKIEANQFQGVYVAGGTPPLNWDFPTLKDRKQFQLLDPDGDGIYEVIIHFSKVYSPSSEGESKTVWKLSKNISSFPQYESPDVLIDALYNQALEEMTEDIRKDGAFMAGAKWDGVWTRDISYSIFLALAIVNPDVSKTSLMAKVKDGKIIQDTGTGGAWPVSSDRMTWALAAWEIYKVTGDKNWLKDAYNIIKKSSEADRITIFDESTGLMCGESSFLDWREQTYPAWMDPKDIFKSKNLGTNAVHYQTYMILSQMAKTLNEPGNEFQKIASGIKNGMNKYLWMEDKGYYGQYLYGREYMSLSPRSEALGEALSVLFNIADSVQQRKVVQQTPVLEYGIPCIFPQIPNMPPYHNDAVWPFVEAFWGLASAKVNNVLSVERAMASIYRAAALFLTNKENMVATTGDHMGTEINSDRQLWSLAGNLAMTYKIIFGMKFDEESLKFQPYIPETFKGTRTLKNFRYRNSLLSITVKGFGNRINSFSLDGKMQNEAFIPGNLIGEHSIIITMADNKFQKANINLQMNVFAPETPQLKEYEAGGIAWDKIEGAGKYSIFLNGKKVREISQLSFKPRNTTKSTAPADEYQVMAIGKNNIQSFLSAPVVIASDDDIIVIEAEANSAKALDQYPGFKGNGYVLLSKNDNNSLTIEVDIKFSGTYSIDFRYSNGNGPINTDNKCAIRNLKIDDNLVSAVVFPQRGEGAWSDWGYTNSVTTKLSAGKHTLKLYMDDLNDNMNGKTNSALLDDVRLTLLNKLSNGKAVEKL